MADNEEETLIERATIPIFNRKISDVPCFRNSFMYGILGGFGTGIPFFLYSSKVRRSCDVAVFTFVTVTAGYWCYCRYQWSQQRFVYRQLKAGLHEYMKNEGTTMEQKPEEV